VKQAQQVLHRREWRIHSQKDQDQMQQEISNNLELTQRIRAIFDEDIKLPDAENRAECGQSLATRALLQSPRKSASKSTRFTPLKR